MVVNTIMVDAGTVSAKGQPKQEESGFWRRREECRECCRRYAAADEREGEFANFVPLVGVIAAKDRTTTPDQFRTYLRLAGESGSKSVMVAFHKAFLGNTNLIEVAREEFSVGRP